MLLMSPDSNVLSDTLSGCQIGNLEMISLWCTPEFLTSALLSACEDRWAASRGGFWTSAR